VAFCLSRGKAEEIVAELDRLISAYDHESAVGRSLHAYGNIFVVEDLDTALSAVNAMAPENLELMCEEAEEFLPRIHAAGAVFLGAYSPESVGDYYCGNNHVLPTGGKARFSSGLSVTDFMRGCSIVRYTREAMQAHGPAIRTLAEAEGLRSHMLAADVRRE